VAGKHRKPNPLLLTLRTTGGLVAGAAVLGTAAATAQASVPSIGQPASPPKAAADAVIASKSGKPRGKSAGEARSSKSKNSSTANTTRRAPSKAIKRPTAEDAITLAKRQVGVSENPNGETMFQDWYMSTQRATETVRRDGGSIEGYNDAEWCDMFISWIGDHLGFSDQFGSDAWTVAHAEWFRDQGRWGTRPQPGAIVFFAWDGGKSLDDISHVGMVIRDNDDGTIQTVEGNTSNAVETKERSIDDVVGYGYPDYAG
jgi:hypothetical protein